jgi:MFS family permease
VHKTAAGSQDAIPGHIWWLAVVLAFGGVMAGLDTSIVNVGLAAIGSDLSASLAATQWVQSGYLLALAAALPACGWVSRRVGAGRLWLWSLAGFTIASGLCALAPDMAVLIAFRVLQGVAGGFLVPSGMTVLGQVAGPARMGRVMATSSVPAILAPAVGPVVGAALVANLSWQWLFLVNLPVGVLGLVIGLRTVPRGDRVGGARIDLPALLLVVAGLPLLTYAVTEAAEQRSLVAPTVLVPLLAGVVALAAFVRRSLRTAAPLLDLRLFHNRVYRAASLGVFFNGTALFGGLIVMPLYFQLLLARDVWGLIVTAASTVPLALLPADPNLVLVEALQVARGIGLALSGTPTVSAAFATVQPHQMPDATAQTNVLSRVGGALGSALFVVILTDNLPTGTTGAASVDAFHTTFWWLTAATVAALVGAAWLVREQRRATPIAPEIADLKENAT